MIPHRQEAALIRNNLRSTNSRRLPRCALAIYVLLRRAKRTPEAGYSGRRKSTARSRGGKGHELRTGGAMVKPRLQRQGTAMARIITTSPLATGAALADLSPRSFVSM